MVKKGVEEFYEFHFSLLFYSAFHSHDICQEIVKKWTDRIFSNSLFL